MKTSQIRDLCSCKAPSDDFGESQSSSPSTQPCVAEEECLGGISALICCSSLVLLFRCS